MKTLAYALVFGLGFLAAILLWHSSPPPVAAGGGTPAAGVPAKPLWTCGMHPQIIQDHPGNCPICGMKLTPVRKQPPGAATPKAAAATGGRKIKSYKSTMMPGEVSPTPGNDSMGMAMAPVYEDAATPGGETNAITIDAATTQNMNLRTGAVIRGPLRRAIRTVGAVDYDETAMSDVTTKFRGWIETLYADSTGKQMHKGEPLFEIYSPELYSAQAEYLLALKSGDGAEMLKASALTKLKFFDISDAQIAELERTRQPRKTLKVLAPRDGVVVEKMTVEGQMADAGMKLFRIADLGTVWVLAQVYEQDLPYVRLGQEAKVSLSYLPDRIFRGRVTYVYPSVDERTRTAKVRLEFHNPGYLLKPGMFATVTLEAELAKDAALVPEEAVLRSGETNTVFVALPGGRFDPRTVTLGPRSEDGFYQILDGVKAGETVVTSGQFMLDSESQLREAIAKMETSNLKLETRNSGEPGAGGKRPDGAPAEKSQITNPKSKIPPVPVYLCPMPEHVSITYKQPGACPLCGMALVPVPPDLLAQIQPGEAVDHYTCPMPEHADVQEAKPGKCPKCGMTLVPVMKTAPASAPAAAAPASGPEAAAVWSCPMHPQIRQDHAGDCPICGMHLVSGKK